MDFDRFESGERWGIGPNRLLEQLPHALLLLDTSGRVLFANDAAAAMFGTREPSRLIGHRFHLSDLIGRWGWVLLAEDGSALDPSDHPFSLVARTGQAVKDVRFKISKPRAETVTVSCDGFPVSGERGDALAIALLCQEITERSARDEEIGWMRQELIENRRHVEELLGYSEALNAIDETVHSTLVRDEVMGRVVREALKTLSADIGTIALLEEGHWVIRVAEASPADGADSLVGVADPAHAQLVAQTRTPLVVPDARRDARLRKDPLVARRAASLLSVPLMLRNDVIGMLSFACKSASRFSGAQVSFAMRVAATTSLGIENARLYSEERHIAETLQTALLEVPATVRGIEHAHLYRSATEAAFVGGDFFDFFEIDEDSTGIVIGDVSGKGVEAATLASFVRQLIRAHAQEGNPPSAVLRRTNDLVFRVSNPSTFVTILFGILTSSGQLTYSNAGHPTPFVLRGRGRVDALLESSPLVGAWEDLEYTDGTTTLAAADVLVLYTDGVTEAHTGDDMFGEHRLLDVLSTMPVVKLQEIPARILEKVERFAGGVLRDDVAIVCCRPER